MINIEIFSKAMYSSWCWHKPSRILFDCGEGMSLHLGARIFGIETVAFGHGHQDHCSGIMSLIGLRAKTKGDTEKPLEILYPYDNRQFGFIKEYVRNTYPRLPFELIWTPIQPGFERKINNAHSLIAFGMEHQKNTLTLGYKLTESRTRLRPEFVGKDIPALIREGKTKNDLNETYVANTFAYCLDQFKMNPEDIKGCTTAVMDCTFLQEKDRNDKTHATAQESIDICAEAGVKHMIAAHISVRYSNGFDMNRLMNELKIPLDLKVTFCDNMQILEL